MTRPFVLLLIFAVMGFVTSQANAADKYALLIGVAKYDHAEMNKPEALQFPEEDAKALGDLLKSGGYEIELLLGKAATQKAIREKLEGLKQKADADGVVLIGLFGHGVEMETVDAAGTLIKDGCFCPYDTAIREALDFRGKPVPGPNKKTLLEPDPGTLIKLAELMRALRLAKAGNRIVLADCCRTTPNAARGRSFGANFTFQDLPENTSLLFGCSPNEQAFEHKDWGHGAFTKCLLDSIGELSAQGRVDTAQLASEMKKRVPVLVASVSPSKKQTPKPFITDVVDLDLSAVTLSVSPSFVSKSSGMTFQLVPAGEFMMGSSNEEVVAFLKANPDIASNELLVSNPAHKVRINSSFFLGTHEVTQREYEKVTKRNPSGHSRQGEYKNKVKDIDTSMFPVENVTWYDCVEFCNRLSESDGLVPFYEVSEIQRSSDDSITYAKVLPKAGQSTDAAGYRLPTEAEWEYACRARTKTASHYGHSLPTRSEANLFGRQMPMIVGSFSGNAFGLRDMHGNVEEWCEDCFDEWVYRGRSGVTNDPLVFSQSLERVCRGKGYCGECDQSFIPSTARSGVPAAMKYTSIGFRVACRKP